MHRLALALCALSFTLAACGGEDGMSFPDRPPIVIIDAAGTPDSNPLLPDAGPGPDGSVNPENCNTTQQNCVDPVESKCTVICTTPSTCETECLAPTGTVGEGGT